MSRGQQNDTFQTSQQENKTFNQNAQDAFGKSQADVGNFGAQLSKFAAANPYGSGGEFESSENKITANTADAAARAAGQTLQGEAVRTGENSGSAVAATEAMQEQNERDLAGQQAGANQTRIGDAADYGKAVLAGTGTQEQMQDTLAQQQAAAAQGALGTQEQAAQAPSFGDMLFNGVMQAGAGFAQGFGGGMAKGCWIAAELWGGWEDERVKLVRMWLWSDYGKSRHGALVLRAYSRWGMDVARAIRTRRWLRAIFQRIFDAALQRARVWADGGGLDGEAAAAPVREAVGLMAFFGGGHGE